MCWLVNIIVLLSAYKDVGTFTTTFSFHLFHFIAKSPVIAELQTHLNLPSEQQKSETIKQLLQKLKYVDYQAVMCPGNL